MQDLRVTLVQADQIWEDKEANFKNYERLLSNSEPTDLILFPEMFNTGFSMNAESLAESFSDSKSIEWLIKMANQKNAAIYTSLIIIEEDHFYNRGVFVFPTGDLAHYDKRKTFGLAGEDKIFKAGKSSTIVNYLGWKINLQICYDLRFPEISLNFMNDGEVNYDLSLYVANWPERRISHWNSLLPARAIENQSYVVAVNRVGVDQTELRYNGQSQLIDALGYVNNVGDKEIVFATKLQAEYLAETRLKLPFLKDRNVKI